MIDRPARPSSAQGRKRIARVTRRVEYLRDRIASAVKRGGDPSFDVGEVSALRWLLEIAEAYEKLRYGRRLVLARRLEFIASRPTTENNQ